MRTRHAALIAALSLLLGMLAAPAAAGPASCNTRTNNTINKLLECVTLDGAREHQTALQAIADENNGTRASGTPGYDASVEYAAGVFEAAGYDVTVQPFEFNFSAEFLTAERISPLPRGYLDGREVDAMTFSGEGNVTAAIYPVDLAIGNEAGSTSGCDVADFIGYPPGTIALMQRGGCSFAVKAANAEAAGASAAIVFNQGNDLTDPSRTGLFFGTLGAPGTGIPVISMSYFDGVELAELNTATGAVIMHIAVATESGVRTSYNVLAESPKGNPDNVVMVGAHLDSVVRGPGIQDNGTGSAAILEVAEAMAKVKPVNQVRFALWGSEEFGLLGSNFYVANLSEEELDEIALYLNFDMIGSPNHAFFIYDGDGSGFGLVGPDGSDDIEALFEKYYADRGIPSEPTAFSGRSDYQAFINNGIPAGGLFTGAEGIKTEAQVALYGGVAGEQYDPCYHLACDTYDNINLYAYDVNTDAVAYATLNYAMSTELINGGKSKGNFKPSHGHDEAA